MGILANENAIETGGYNIANSLRFQSASSQSLSRTPASAGSRTTWTWSAWVKLGNTPTGGFFGSVSNTSNWGLIQLNSSSQLRIVDVQSGATQFDLNTTQVFRDPSAWYHFIVVLDTTQATASNRVKMYVNGVQITAFTSSSYPSLNATPVINVQSISNQIGTLSGVVAFLDGYMTEVNFIDGQALTPSSFGETNTLTGQWVAKKYTGTYGTNGFYLPFSNGTSTTTLGYDSSGNSNNWTLTNFTRSAGVSDCWMYDVPSGNGSQAGGTQPNSNYAVLNPLTKTGAGSLTISNSNLRAAGSAAGYIAAVSTVGMTSGKYYFEAMLVSSPGTSDQWGFGLYDVTKLATSGTPWQYSTTYSLLGNGNKYTSNASAGATGVGTFGANDVMGVAFDADAGTLQINKNGGAFTTVFSSIPAGTYLFGVNTYASTDIMTANFGQRSFAYTPPSGFKALCTANLPASTIVKGNQYMDVLTYTGTGGTRTLTGLNFQPDMVWSKSRSSTINHTIIDAVRGVGSSGSSKSLVTNNTEAESWSSANFGYLSSFNNNGVTYTAGSSNNDQYNQNTVTYVQWNWNAGGSTVTNTNGSISSQVRANPTAGVSVVTYTGTGANATVGHGLGVAPAMVIIKPRNIGSYDWQVWQKSFVTASNTDYLLLNQTVSKGYYGANALWNSTVPSSSVISLGTYTGVNGSTNTYVAYCFAEIAGFSKFGSYTGNGSADGTFIYLGFRPKFFMIKGSTNTYNWIIDDSSRSPTNVAHALLNPNLSDAENTSVNEYDFTANGVKIRTSDIGLNQSGQTYIYMAFAENPFANANAR